LDCQPYSGHSNQLDIPSRRAAQALRGPSGNKSAINSKEKGFRFSYATDCLQHLNILLITEGKDRFLVVEYPDSDIHWMEPKY
jgi:hypothetical protein